LPKINDRYEFVNSIIIWLTVGFLSFLVVQTSGSDYSSFGQNQLLMLGIITLLLLFKYIKKIKIGNIIDIEFDKVQEHIDTLIRKTDTSLVAIADITPNYIDGIRDELLTIKGNLENIKTRAYHT
jgi:hypothetical protein